MASFRRYSISGSPAACIGHALDILDYTTRRHERIGRLMHHQDLCAGSTRSARQCARIADAASNAPDQGNAAVDVLGRRMHHRFGFDRGQPVELAGIAVGNEQVNTCRDVALDNRAQSRRDKLIVTVKGRPRMPEIPPSARRSCGLILFTVQPHQTLLCRCHDFRPAFCLAAEVCVELPQHCGRSGSWRPDSAPSIEIHARETGFCQRRCGSSASP